MAVHGDRTGGNIATMFPQQRREGIAHQMLIYPVMDVSRFGMAAHEKFVAGYEGARGE